MIEIRNDLISDDNGQVIWAKRLAEMLERALKLVTQQEKA